MFCKNLHHSQTFHSAQEVCATDAERGGEVGENLRTVVPVGVILCMFAFHGRRSHGFSLVVTGQK